MSLIKIINPDFSTKNRNPFNLEKISELEILTHQEIGDRLERRRTMGGHLSQAVLTIRAFQVIIQ